MTPEEEAWVAGIIEGEGYIRHVSRAYRLVVTMTDEDIIRRVHAVTGVGTVNGPYQAKGNRKPAWRWQSTRKAETVEVLRRIRPWLGDRRGREADAVLAAAEKAPRPGRGVSKQGNRWVAYGPSAQTDRGRKQPYLGSFSTEEEALRAREEYQP